MKINLKREYPKADLNNKETLKQITINKFKEYGLRLQKIRNVEDGFYIYSPYARQKTRTDRILVRKISKSEFLYKKEKVYYNSSLILTDETLEDFENELEMILQECLIRKGKRI